MNRVFPYELGLQGTLFTLQVKFVLASILSVDCLLIIQSWDYWQFFNAVTSTSILQLLLLLIHTIYFGYHTKL